MADGTNFPASPKENCMNRLRLLLPIAVAAIGIACNTAAQSTNAPAAQTNLVSIFKDKRLEDVVRQQVFAKRETNSPLTAADVATVSTISGNFRGITSLAGLEHCKAIASIDLAGNQITDLSPLKGLKQLQYLNIASNRITDVAPLGTVPALQYIELSNNQVADVAPLASCTNLASIYLSRNRLTSITPVTGLPRVATLYADGNKLKSVAGVQNLKWLTSISLSGNQINDVTPLTSFRAPTWMLLEKNKIKDLTPLYRALTNDNAGPKNYAPFLNLHVTGNPLNRASKKQLEELKKIGTRVKF